MKTLLSTLIVAIATIATLPVHARTCGGGHGHGGSSGNSFADRKLQERYAEAEKAAALQSEAPTGQDAAVTAGLANPACTADATAPANPSARPSTHSPSTAACALRH